MSPELASVPFISGNAKGFRNHYVSVLKDEMNRVLPKFVDASRRNENIPWNNKMVLNHINGASSEITNVLEHFIKNNIDKSQKKRSHKNKVCSENVFVSEAN
jgi:hypothetical protein